MSKSTGIWVPTEVLALDIGPMHWLFLGHIMGLCREKGECNAKNKHFAAYFRVSERYVSKVISELEAAGHLKIKGGKDRIISVTLNDRSTLNDDSMSSVYSESLDVTLNNCSTLNDCSRLTPNDRSMSESLTLNACSDSPRTNVPTHPEQSFQALYKVESKEESKKENLEEEDKKGDSEFFEKGETPPFVKANREKIKNLIPVGPSPEQVSEWLFQNSSCREHACLKIKSIKKDSDEDYRNFIAHFIRFNVARETADWKTFEKAAEHFMKSVSKLNGHNPALETQSTNGKPKPKSGSLVPVASEPRPKPEPGGRKPGKFSGVKL